ncbi:MAG: GNAT family N-acetyltransferase [Gemmatimonadota bacterium]
MGGVRIRPALPGELPAIGDLRLAAYRADGFLTAESTYAPTLRELGADGGGEVLAAVDGGTLLGTVMLQPWPYADELVRAPHEAEIRALAVAPQARGRGVGAALVTAVTERALTLGVRRLLLLTRPDMLAAQRLYARAGFRRLPDRDWSPRPDLLLLAYGKELTAAGA